MTNHQRKLEVYRTGNVRAAEIIAAEPERYPGAMQEWAAIVLFRAEERTEPAIGEAA